MTYVAIVLALLAIGVSIAAFNAASQAGARRKLEDHVDRVDAKEFAKLRKAGDALKADLDTARTELKLVKKELADVRLALDGMPAAVRLVAREAASEAMHDAADALTFQRHEDAKGA